MSNQRAYGTRVKIRYPKRELTCDLNKAFHGATGRIIGSEKDGSCTMYRVQLDEPVLMESEYGNTTVEDDMWASRYLKTIKTEAKY